MRMEDVIMGTRRGVCGHYLVGKTDRLTLETDYPIPNDEVCFVAQRLTVCPSLTQAPRHQSELDRLDLQHHLLTVLFGGKLHLAPLNEPKKILDLGTGTGIWAIDMADLYPDATVIGTDLSPVQPQWCVASTNLSPLTDDFYRRVPNNVHFEIEDVESDWTYTEDSFDYIHIRMLIGAISDWSSIIRKAYRY